jgi:hypothetical protein
MSEAKPPSKVRVTGTIASLRIMDVSKRAGVENMKSYVQLQVETVDPAEMQGKLAARAEFVTDGELAFPVGARVELETHVDAASIGRLPIYRIAAL